MNARISALILTKNEAGNLPDCLESISWVDEVIIVDDQSTDNTVDIARTRGCKVIVHPMQSYPEQRNIGIESSSNDWILRLDADERIPLSLRDEILGRIQHDNGRYTAYSMLRQEFLLWRPVRYTEWGPRRHWKKQYIILLFRKSKWRFRTDQTVHELLDGEGRVGWLRNPAHHTNANPDLNTRFLKTLRYAHLQANMEFQQGRRVGAFDFFWGPLLGFAKSYIWFRGFMDGLNGWIIAWCNMLTEFFVCSYIFEKQEEVHGLDARRRQVQQAWRET